jgi:hypothetical protein
MEIIIHGTKGGYKILYATPGIPELIAMDVRPTTSRESAVGQEAYAIAFVKGGCVFSKYKIIRDVMEDKRTGNIAVSLYIPSGKKLSGSDVQELLDELLKAYCSNYIVDDNLDNVHEDWRFVDSFKDNYTPKTTDPENYQPGANEAAFIYYTPENLQRYLDDPDQTEYIKYKQIYLIDSDREGKDENPLNALRHDKDKDITPHIDLNNPKYKLHIENGNDIEIQVKVDGTERYDGNKIRRKDLLEIVYTQLFRKPKPISGNWKEIQEQYPESISVDDEKETVTIKPIIRLEEEHKITTIKVLDTKEELRITCKNLDTQEEKKVNSTQIEFIGDEIGQTWNIIKINEHPAAEVQFTPKNTNEIKIKFIKLYVIDAKNGDIIPDFTWKIDKKEGKTDEIYFIDDAIHQKHKIKISATGNYFNKIADIQPTRESEITIKLTNLSDNTPTKNTLHDSLKQQFPTQTTGPRKNYFIDVGDGKKGPGAPDIWHSLLDFPPAPIPPEGQIFKEWTFTETTFQRDNVTYEGTYQAIYGKKCILSFIWNKNNWSKTNVVIAIISICVIGVAIFYGTKKESTNPNTESDAKIEDIVAYTEGVELNPDTMDLNKISDHIDSLRVEKIDVSDVPDVETEEPGRSSSANNSGGQKQANDSFLQTIEKYIKDTQLSIETLNSYKNEIEENDKKSSPIYDALLDCINFRTWINNAKRNQDKLVELFRNPTSSISKQTAWYRFLGTIVNSPECSRNVTKLQSIKGKATKTLEEIQTKYSE